MFLTKYNLKENKDLLMKKYFKIITVSLIYNQTKKKSQFKDQNIKNIYTQKNLDIKLDDKGQISN